jgi:hypothetical protein
MALAVCTCAKSALRIGVWQAVQGPIQPITGCIPGARTTNYSQNTGKYSLLQPDPPSPPKNGKNTAKYRQEIFGFVNFASFCATIPPQFSSVFSCSNSNARQTNPTMSGQKIQNFVLEPKALKRSAVPLRCLRFLLFKFHPSFHANSRHFTRNPTPSDQIFQKNFPPFSQFRIPHSHWNRSLQPIDCLTRPAA